jgi:hypothetical protein
LPSSVLAVVSAFASRAVLGWAVAFPLTATIAALGTGHLETGDRALFAPSGLHLLELLRRGSTTLIASGKTALILLALASALHALPTALVFATAAPGRRGYAGCLRLAWLKLPRFLGLGALELAACGAAAVVSWLLWSALRPPESAWRTAFDVVSTMVGLSCVSAAAILADLARARSMATDTPLTATLDHALGALGSRRLELACRYVLATGAGALSIALAARAVGLCHVEREGSARVLGALFLHWGVLASLTVIQAWWARRLYATPDSPRA